MKRDIQVHIKSIISTDDGYAVFLTNNEKCMAVYIDDFVGEAIILAYHNVPTPRPSTHQLINNIFAGLNVTVEKAVICDYEDETYYAHLYLSQNEAGSRHVIEIDARPSDCIAIALFKKAPIFVNPRVWEETEDMTWALKQNSENEN